MRALPSLTIVLAMSAISAMSCGPNARTDIDGGGSNNGSDGGNNNNGGDGGSNTDDCADSAKLVYVVDEDNTLSQFDPSTKTFTDLGSLSCPTTGFEATPFSMSIDRVPSAWVEYNDGELFHVALPSLDCTATNWSEQLGLAQFGMGFSSDTSGGSSDTLYIGGGSSDPGDGTGTATLATLDTSTMTATKVGTISGWPELTGNDSAELWGFFPSTTAPKVENINKTNAAAITTYPANSLSGMPMAWAFAFWGGDYWIFLMKGDDEATTVYQMGGSANGSAGTIVSQTPTNTRTIVGAGVSTCAPVIIPAKH